MRERDQFFIVARTEAKIGMRGKLFGLSFVLIVGIIGLFHLALQSEMNTGASLDAPLPCSFPLMNSILFNLLQFCFIIFSVLQYFSREKNIDSLEALRVKPVSGTCYALGKAAGIAFPFFCLNVFSLIMAAFIQWGWSNSPFKLEIYLFYLFTFTIPVLVFVLGMTLFIHGLIRNRIVTLQILLLIAVVCYVFLSSSPFLDPFARCLPNVFSDVIGLVEPKTYFLQRGSFLLVGIGLLFVSMIFSQYLTNRQVYSKMTTWLGIVFLLGGISLGYLNFSFRKAEQTTRETYRTTALNYVPAKQLSILSHDIEFRQEGRKIYLKSHLVVKNNDSLPVQQVHFYLNPGLQISSLQEGNQSLPFRRENQVVEVERIIKAKENVKFTFEYKGDIDERACYLEVPWERLNSLEKLPKWEAYFSSLNLQGTFGRRFCFTDENFTLLIPENMWYPTLLPPVNVHSPQETVHDFSLYTLKVLSKKKNCVLSQGMRTQTNDTVLFRNEELLLGLTLCIGDFEEINNGKQDSLFALLTFKGHELHPLLRDNISDMFTPDFFSNLHTHTPFAHYAYKRLYFAEVPVSFTSYYRYWKESEEFTQPEFFLQREGWEANVVKHTMDLKGKESSEIPKYFLLFLRNYNTISLFSKITCHPKEFTVWPMLLKNAIWRSHGRWSRRGSNSLTYSHKRELYELEAKKYLNGHSLENALRDNNKLNEGVLYKILDLKGEELLAYLTYHSSIEKMSILADSIIEMDEIVMDETRFLQLIHHCTGVVLSPFLREWYTTSKLPHYQVTDERYLKGNEQYEGEYVSFKIQNKGEADGFIEISEDNWLRDYIFLKKGECKEITVQTPSRYFKIGVGLSKNIPGSFDYAFRKSEELTSAPGIKEIDSSFFQSEEEAIIVDNSSPGFRLESDRIPILQRLFHSDNKTNIYTTQGERWTRVIHGRCYGDSIRDAFYKLTGDGKYKAIWETTIKEAGEYEVFFYDVDISFNKLLSRLHPAQERLYIVKDREGEHEISISQYPVSGWVSLGKFYLESGKASVILMDKKEKEEEKEWENPLYFQVRDFFTWGNKPIIKNVATEIIIADAIKWVRVQ